MVFGMVPVALLFQFPSSQRKEPTIHRFFGHFPLYSSMSDKRVDAGNGPT
jgi:hypothetical protein